MATNTSSQDLKVLGINLVKSKAAWQQMLAAGNIIKPDEFYLVQGDEATTYTFANGDNGTFTVTPSDSTAQTVNVITNQLSVAKGGTGRQALTLNATLVGNATGQVKMITSKSGAYFATADNAEPQFGTLPVGQGGTGVTSIANIQAGKDADGNIITSTYATKEELNNLVSTVDALVFKGVIDDTHPLPDTHEVGWVYRVGVAGTYAGKVCEIGDLIICIADGTTANNSDWIISQTNIDGAVTGPTIGSVKDGAIVAWDGTTGRVVKKSNSSHQGSSSLPIYLDSDGVPQEITSYQGNAGSADKLKTAVTIAISGLAVGTATSFDGSANISIPVTSLRVQPDATNNYTITGTLPTNNGGTGYSKSALTQNRLIRSASTGSSMIEAASLYTTGANLAINKTSITEGYNFEVSGKSKLDGSVSHASGHIYLEGAQASSSTSNTTQLVFGTSSSQHIALSSNTGAFIINPSTSSTTGQIVLKPGNLSYISSGKLAINANTNTDSNYTLYVNGTTNITGATSLSNNLTVGGTTNLSGALNVTGVATFNNETDSSATTNGSVVVKGGVGIAKQLRVGGATTISGNTSVGGTLGVTGATTLSSTLNVTGATTLSSTLGVTGATTLSSTLGVTGVATFNNETDSTELGVGSVVIKGGTSIAKQLRVGGATTLSNNLSVSGATNLTGSLTVSGKVIFSNDASASNTAGAVEITGGVLIKCNADATTHTTNGALVVLGGVNIVKKLRVANDFILYANGDDRSIIFGHANTTDASTAIGASWRLAHLDSGSLDAKYFVLQSSTSTTGGGQTWHNVVRFGMNSYDAYFAGNINPFVNATQTVSNKVVTTLSTAKTIGIDTQRWKEIYVLNSRVAQIIALDDNTFWLADKTVNNNTETITQTIKFVTTKDSMAITPYDDLKGSLGDPTHRWSTFYVGQFSPDYTYTTTSGTIGQGWIDLFKGTAGSNILTDGTYVIQLSISNGNDASVFENYYSGICSWICAAGGSNITTLYTEIPLHAVQKSLDNQFFLRTAIDSSGITLQISQSSSTSTQLGTKKVLRIKMKKIM